MNSNRQWLIGWLIAFLGFPPGGALALLIVGAMENPLEGLVGGAAAGLIIGAAQALALNRRIAVGPRWAVATAAGLGIGTALSAALVGSSPALEATLLRAPIVGLVLGLAQALLLRPHTRWAFVWPLVTTALFPAAWYITAQVIGQSLGEGFVIFGASGALFYQVLTALSLSALLSARTPVRPAA